MEYSDREIKSEKSQFTDFGYRLLWIFIHLLRWDWGSLFGLVLTINIEIKCDAKRARVSGDGEAQISTKVYPLPPSCTHGQSGRRVSIYERCRSIDVPAGYWSEWKWVVDSICHLGICLALTHNLWAFLVFILAFSHPLSILQWLTILKSHWRIRLLRSSNIASTSRDRWVGS